MEGILVLQGLGGRLRLGPRVGSRDPRTPPPKGRGEKGGPEECQGLHN